MINYEECIVKCLHRQSAMVEDFVEEIFIAICFYLP